ncbi:hypothetical protein M409DRAFT_70515 [Zasmidium cellare ATCC 36951]|uniref:Methyltransferase domain-containing protein n=1 Tax=Zasmidium cellare ATCC 36951 TaxID=1080233 RepID=A0A6A6BZX4_ZASCE|nr:uncharacterized protein M409DRAFT_70515 [Zasmidium cellare ATCC 36951]KAF2160354.1 hypothetical protein M409DRAFT_70515 [Zasmidium cellare ATCC 36951]
MPDPSTTSWGQSNQFLQRAYDLTGAADAEQLYNEWADSYDFDIVHEYASPQRAVEAVIKNLDDNKPNFKILDAGCGTGLVGDEFKKSSLNGKFTLDGLDLTPGMLAAARKKNIYTDLETADLTKPINRTDGSYDVVTCVGTLTKGHVGPAVLNEFVRVVAKGGLVVGTVHEDIWESGGFKSVVEGLEKAGQASVVSTDGFGILKGEWSGGIMLVLRKK